MDILTCKEGIIELNIANPSCIQNIELDSERLGNVLEVILICWVDIFRESLAVLISQVIPTRRNHRNLDLAPLTFWNESLEIVVRINKSRLALVLNLTVAKTGLPWSVTFLNETSNIWNVWTEDVHFRLTYLCHTVESLEESSPEDLTSTTVRNGGCRTVKLTYTLHLKWLEIRDQSAS